MIIFPDVYTVEEYFALPEITFFVSDSDLQRINKSEGSVSFKDGDTIYRNVQHYYCGLYEQFGRSDEGLLVGHSKYVIIDYELVNSLTITYGSRDMFPESAYIITFSNQDDLKKYVRFIEARNEFIYHMCDQAVIKAKETIDSSFEYELLHNTCNTMRESLTNAIFENNFLFYLLMVSFGKVSSMAEVFLSLPEITKRNIFQIVQTDHDAENMYRQLLEWVKNASSLFVNSFAGINEHVATLAVYLMVYRGLLDHYSEVWTNEYDRTQITVDAEHYIYECVERHTVSSTDARSVAALIYYLLNVGAISDNYRIPYEYVLNCITKAENGEPISTLKKEVKPDSQQDLSKKIYVNESSALDELNSLIGLNGVKNDVIELTSLVQMNMKRKEKGLPTIPVSLHLVFTGNPGTGKTTVARILAKLYKEIGVLPKGQLVEVDRSGLVAGYVGQTALKTKEKIQEAMGGILFIDEAYSLSKDGQDFGQEAIDTILKAMEDYRDKFVVIAAGYPDLMKTFINSNPGLRSRFNKYISFEDYDDQDLVKIFVNMCQKYNLSIEAEALEKVKSKIRSLVNKKDDNFANARDIRNMFENIVTNQARRLAFSENISEEDMTCIKVEDI